VYGDMHRYIPILAKRAGFGNIGEKVVQHQERQFGSTKYGFQRYINGPLDLLTISFITRFAKKPMHFFGTMGMLMMLIGMFITIWPIGVKIHAIATHKIDYRAVTDQPLFFLALLIVIIGVQLFLTGFIGELISRSSNDRNNYLIEEEL